MSRLHRLLDRGHQRGGQVLKIDLVAQLRAEGRKSLFRVVFSTVEPSVDEALYTAPDGVEQGCDDQRRSHHRKLGVASGECGQDLLQQRDAAEVDQGKRERQGTVDEGAVDDYVYVVQAMPEHGQGHRRGYREEGDQEQHVSNHGRVERRPDADHNYDGRKQRDGVGYPFDLLALLPPRPTETQNKGEDHGQRDGSQEQGRNTREQIQYPCATFDAERVYYRRAFGKLLQRTRSKRVRRDRQRSVCKDEPCYRSPAGGRQPTVGEEQENEEYQRPPGDPDPGGQPGRHQSSWQIPQLGEQRVGAVVASEHLDRVDNARAKREPADRVLPLP